MVGWRGPELAVRLGLTAGGLAVVALWWVETSAVSLHGAGQVLTAAGRVSGLLAAYLVLVEVLLLARVPAIERAVGLDRLAAWHRGLGTNVVLLIGVHVLLEVWGYGLTDHHQPFGELITVVTSYPDMWKATIGALLFVLVGITSGRIARSRLSYELWYGLHLTVYIAVLLTFFHQTSNGADFVANSTARTLWTLMYLAVAACVVVWRVALPAAAVLRHRMRVEQVVREGPGVVSVWIRGRDLDRLGAAPGQFLLWRFASRGQLFSAHAYSLSAPPTPDRLRITVKAAGDHSRAIERLRPGTPALAEGPFGLFTARRTTRGGGVLLIGGGSGIAPVRALAEDLARRGRDVVVVQRARQVEDLVLHGELCALAEAGLLTVHSVTGSRDRLGFDPLAAPYLAAAVPDIADRDVFLCGPPGMTRAVVQTLRQLGVADQQIHTEEFALR
ncbi:ferric reductase-like transmembrane domain-containing protein [Frankia sp. R82]|uniref:ferredoxin reductase family protein n=1 Tax=Frankia sp. R82 TaxID=2950553 RepID=UPI002044A3A9|nr:ferric reductase-like transmembrane domain-containing protein [Frankia sp. R82]MCM3887255.1 ferric reductase-like transmembrane domain-containing protein [Frankia sp. R82]